jgi:predicted nucleic acid-binding protein
VAGHARLTAVLDACVLFPIATADALVSLAVAGLFSAKWTVAIEDEWLAVAERRHPGFSGRFTTRRDAMRDAVLDWEVNAEGWKALAPSLTLPDPNDVHVLAAAIAGHADCIVTTNLKDFPASILEVYGLVALHPDDFIVAQLDLDLYSALGALKAMRARKRNPTYSAEEFAAAMERNGLVATAERLRRAVDLI